MYIGEGYKRSRNRVSIGNSDPAVVRLANSWIRRFARFQRKSNSGQLKGRNWRSRHGVLTVCANDTYLRARLQAWIDCVQAAWLQFA